MNDAELLTDHGADAFAEFYRRHARAVAAYLVRSTGDVEAAADLTAETFAAALAARHRYRPERGTRLRGGPSTATAWDAADRAVA